MLTPQDVRSVQFEKNLRGYRTEDVDRFLDKVEQQLEQDAEQMEALRKQVADLTAENETLRRNMQSYEADGDMLKSALINAQRMGENVIREANQKAEDILHTATGKKNQGIKNLYDMRDGSFFYLAPDNYNNFGSGNNNLYLFRRGDKVFDYDNNNAYNGYISTIDKFCPPTVIMVSDVKVGIAFREIKGERFALLVYDVTITPTTPAPPAP